MRSFDKSVPGPTLRLKPGDRLEIKIENKLEKRPRGNIVWNELSHSNRTILHVHGLHVDPKGMGDNMFVNVEAQSSRDYHYELPPDHPAGTFWGHPHSHGSSMIQTAYAMAFPIIVEDLELPKMLRNIHERVLVVQEVEYGTKSGRKKFIFSHLHISHQDVHTPHCALTPTSQVILWK